MLTYNTLGSKIRGGGEFLNQVPTSLLLILEPPGFNKKMVQTTNKGKPIKAGYLGKSSESWKDPSTWTDNGVFYTIKKKKKCAKICPRENFYE